MKNGKIHLCAVGRYFSIVAILTISCMGYGAALLPVIDDFNHAQTNNLGHARQFMTDAMAGGGTTLEHTVEQGVVAVKGNIAPPRGQPGWASMVLLLDAENLPKDASEYEGISIRVKIHTGSLSISANSVEVTNFDYHAAPIVVPQDGKFHELKIPFRSLKRAWSEQTQLNTKTISSVSIVAFGMQQGVFGFDVDEVSFYK